jgi:hypothetical protein
MVTLCNSSFFQELSDIQNMKVENRNYLFILFQLWHFFGDFFFKLKKRNLIEYSLFFKKWQKLATKYNHWAKSDYWPKCEVQMFNHSFCIWLRIENTNTKIWQLLLLLLVLLTLQSWQFENFQNHFILEF